MITTFLTLNWMSIVAASVAYFMLGYLWFVLLFSKPYKISLGKENETLPNNPIFMIGPAICCFVYSLCSAILMNALAIQSIGEMFEFSVIVGLGFLVTNTVNIAINPNIPKPLLYGVISGAYHLVAFSIANLILVSLR